MPIFYLFDSLVFPDPSFAEPDGLLAVGGDLSVERLLLAYQNGIFPWYDETSPILWWSPDPRLIMIPSEIKVSRSLRSILKRGIFELTLDTAFEEVINSCAIIHRAKHSNTWITPEMIEAYIRLHREGYAHSVEVWHKKKLVGGLYGVSLGSAFFGESMFTEMSNASKVALVALARLLDSWGFDFIDCQVVTEHLISMGAKAIPREEFLEMLHRSQLKPTKRGSWSSSFGPYGLC